MPDKPSTRRSISRKIIKCIETDALAYFAKSIGSHDWGHVERVRGLALHIAECEGADLAVVEVAALLHDVAREEEQKARGRICHAERSATISARILKKYAVSDAVADNVIHSVLTHRFRNNHEPATIEARVLYDADKLDSIGAVGLGRDFLFAGEIGARLYNDPKCDIHATKQYSTEDTAYREYMVKLRHIKDRMLTREGRRMAHGRHRFMVRFFERFWAEVEGKV